MTVDLPGRREDVLNALVLLAGDPPALEVNGRDSRWADLTNAVHWLVDDTGWDRIDLIESVGTILRNEHEASVLSRLVALIVGVSGRQGPTASDANWFGDEAWAEVQSTAREAAAVLRAD